MTYLTRRSTFSAAHRYYDPALSPEENRRVFGPCVGRHGHTYTLEVTVRGDVEQRTGFVMDLGELARLIDREVMSVMDHRDLNEEVPELRGLQPTTENVAIVVWKRLAPHLVGATLHRVRVREGEDLWADYYGEP
jgi:6-pyruvoyltetrahydropterin/6-carboxytetrahydropterin synthase